VAAGLLLAPPGHGFEQDCSQCHDPDKRARWGCDAPAAEPTCDIRPCPFCAGKDATCEHCQGTNIVELYRCPHAMVGEREFDLVMLAQHVEQGRLPDPGGWLDQSATFAAVFPTLLREIASWRAKAMSIEQERIRQQTQRRR
jgi:hypothetical protein